VRELGGERARCDLAPLAVEPTLRTPLPDGDAAARRQRLGVPDRYFLAVGKDYPHKGHATLFRAIARLQQRVPVVCAGSQVWRGPGCTRELLDGLGMADQVQWLEGLGDDDVKALIQGAFALVYPSTEEGFGLPPIEAMALGTPVLAAAAMSIPEVCGDGAWLFPPDDFVALTALLQRVQHQPAQVAELVARGRAREATYSWQRCADATVECYGRAIGKGNKGNKLGKRRRAGLSPDVLGALLVQAQSPFRVERELAAWQERCLSVENTLRETLERLRALEPDRAPSPAEATDAATTDTPPPAAPQRPRFSLTRRMRKIRDRLLGRGDRH